MPSSWQSHVGLLTVDMSLPYCFSLKDKRRIVRGLLDTLRSKGNFSVAEVGYADVHTRAIIAVACVASSRSHTERVLNEAWRRIDSREGEGLIVNDWWIEWR